MPGDCGYDFCNSVVTKYFATSFEWVFPYKQYAFCSVSSYSTKHASAAFTPLVEWKRGAKCLMSRRTLTKCVAGCVWRDRSSICSLKASLPHSWMLSPLSQWRTGEADASVETANAPHGGWQLTGPAGTAGGQTAGAPTRWPQRCWMKTVWSSRSSNLSPWPLTLTVTTAPGDRYTENGGVQHWFTLTRLHSIYSRTTWWENAKINKSAQL